MALSDWFREWFDSPYYHRLYFERNDQEAAVLIYKLLALIRPRVDSYMLDIACGRGRHSRILAARGYDVTGIDLSANSISYAKRYENEHLHFLVHDMRQPFYINYFDHAFNLFTSFGYFRTQRENSNAIRSMAQALRPNGTLVLDYLNTKYVGEHLVPETVKVIDGVTYDIRRWCNEKYIFKHILVEDSRFPDRPLEFTERVARFNLGDFNELFAWHGMQIQEVFGDYNLGKFDIRESPRLLMIVRKNPRR